MHEKVKVICLNNNQNFEVEMGTSLLELLPKTNLDCKYPMLAAFVNNRIKELNYKIYKPLTLQYIDITNLEGYRVYQRTISFIVHKAIRDLYGSRKFYIRHSLGHGLYCEFADGEELDSVQIEALRRQMQLIISARYPIHRQKLLTEEVEKIYREYGFEDKITLLNSQKRLYSDIHRMADLVGYFYGALTPDSGYIHLFDIRKYYHGFYIALPTQNDPQTLDLNVHWNKMFDIFQEYHQWVDIMG
ncbi:MAG: nucleoside kinase, partial [Alistipes sp.]|nr:nucleoside kinase [Alistipes sp.]